MIAKISLRIFMNCEFSKERIEVVENAFMEQYHNNAIKLMRLNTC